MTSLTIVWDNEDVSSESLENWCETLIQNKLLTAGFVDKILINNKLFMNKTDIRKHEKLLERLEK